MAVRPGAVWAQPRLIRFHIPAEKTRDALLDLALQANISLGGDLEACGDRNQPVSGQFTLAGALDRLLDGAACTFQFADARTVVIHRVRVTAAADRPTPRLPLAAPPLADRSAALESAVSEIVVTAERRADLPGRTPLAISARSQQEIADTGATDLSDLASEIAGMTVTNLGPGRNKVLLRGLSDGVFTGMTQSTVALYLDNVPVTYNAPDPDLRLVDIQRVEVMRGPQGTLYGGGSMGGIVRVVTNPPDLDQMSGSLEVGGAVTRSGDPSTESDGILNLPIVRGRIALRVSAYSERRGGYIDDVALGLNNVNRVSRDGGRVALRASLTPAWSLTVGAVHQSISGEDTQYAARGLGRLQRANAVREPHDNDFDEQIATLQGEIPLGQLSLISERLVHKLDDRYDASLALAAFGRLPGIAQFDEARQIELFVNEITMTSHQIGRLRWLAGVFQSTGETNFRADLSRRGRRSGLPRLGYTEDRTDRVDELAGYGEATYDLTSRLSVTAGARWFRYSYSTRSLVEQGGASREFEGQGQATGLSPKLLLRYQAAERVMIYLKAAQGYRPGGFNTSGVIGQRFDGKRDNPAREYDPDHLWNFEIGTKLQLWGDRLQLRGAGFYAHWDGIQTDQFLKSGLPYTVNVGDGANLGLEIEAAWRVSDRLQLRLAGLVDDPLITKPSPAFAARPDASLPGVPTGSASAGATYRRPLSPDLELTIDAAASYVGTSHLTFDALKIYDMGGYATGRLSAAIQSRHWRLAAYLDNPFDTGANTFAFGDPFRIGRAAELTPPRPRTLGMRLGASF